ncbi:MAG: FUSC family protein, partial [Terracidiphilus sp.]
MRLKARKTRSQQQLAVKLRMHPKSGEGFFNFERRRLLTLAAKTTLAAALSWWLATLFGVRDGYWGSISAIIVLQSKVGATVTASRDRIIGTAIGAVVGFAFSLMQPLWLGYALA